MYLPSSYLNKKKQQQINKRNCSLNIKQYQNIYKKKELYLEDKRV